MSDKTDFTKCKGCLEFVESSSNTFTHCKIVSKPFVNDCPCGTCIVKSMCSQECEAYTQFLFQMPGTTRGPTDDN